MRRPRRVSSLLVLLPLLSCQGVDFTPPGTATMTISANPTTIPVIAGRTTITISVIEESGIPVANGTVVRFTTTLGEITESRVETKNGLASTELVSSGTGGAATVSAFSGPVSAETMVTIGVTSSAVSLTATPATLPTGGGSVDLVATVFGENDAPLASQSVAFSTTAGSLGSGGQPVVTGSDGVARDTLTTTFSGTVTATAGGAASASIDVTVGVVGSVSIVLSADQVNLSTGGGTVQLVAVVLGASGPVGGVAVAWSSDAGTLGTPGVTLSGLDGRAVNTLTTSTNARVTASAAGVSANLTITVGSTISPVIAVAANRSSITANPSGDCTLGTTNLLPIILTAVIEDGAGNPLPNREVTFFVDFDELSACGRAFGEFCDTNGNTVTVQADSRGIATTYYTMTTDDIAFCNCVPSANCGGLCPSGSCSPICRTTATGPEDLFCQLAFRAVSGGVVSSNAQFVEYGN